MQNIEKYFNPDEWVSLFQSFGGTIAAWDKADVAYTKQLNTEHGTDFSKRQVRYRRYDFGIKKCNLNRRRRPGDKRKQPTKALGVWGYGSGIVPKNVKMPKVPKQKQANNSGSVKAIINGVEVVATMDVLRGMVGNT